MNVAPDILCVSIIFLVANYTALLSEQHTKAQIKAANNKEESIWLEALN